MTAQIITIKVLPNSKINKIIKLSDNLFKVKIMAPAVKGQANQALIKLLAQYFKISKNKIKILNGQLSTTKKIEIIS